MIETRTANQSVILTHTVLTGLTPLIPIPLVDDWVKQYFLRRCVRKLAGIHGRNLDPESVKTLADDDSGCLSGCLSGCWSILLFPLKWVFGIFFLLFKWKRFIDTLSVTYHQLYLVDYALRENLCAPDGPHSAAEIRQAADAVCRQTRTSPVSHAFDLALKQSKTAVNGLAGTLTAQLKKLTKRDEEHVTQTAESLAESQSMQIERVTTSLQTALESVPAEHFQRLHARFVEVLRSPSARAE